MVNNTSEPQPITAGPTAPCLVSIPRHGGMPLNGRRNLLSDTLYEMGYHHDLILVDILIERDVVDFRRAEYTSHVMDDLIERYGEVVLCGGLERAIERETLQTCLPEGR